MKLTIVEKNLLSWTAMHIDFVMCKNLQPVFENESSEQICENFVSRDQSK